MKHHFKTSTKVNTDPAWSLKDYAAKHGLKLSYLKNMRSRKHDFPEPIFTVGDLKYSRGAKLYNVRELDEWFSKNKQEENGQ